MSKVRPPPGNRKTQNSSANRYNRPLSREPPADRPLPTRHNRRSPSPSESESTLPSNSPLSEYSLTYSTHFPDSGIGMAKVCETDKLAKILANMLERSESDWARDEERQEREARDQ